MRLCVDCEQPIPYGVGWGGGGVCPKCRGKRASNAAKRQAELSGKSHGNNRGQDPLVGSRRAW